MFVMRITLYINIQTYMILFNSFRATLPDEAQPLWDCLFDHIIKLVSENVMMSTEAAALFVPCLVSEYSSYQDKVCSVLNTQFR